MRIAALLTALSLTACPPPANREAEEASLMEADRAFAAATAERGLDGWVDAFANDGFMLRPDAPIVPGQGEVRRAMEEVFADTSFALTWEPTMATVSASGDLGFTVGTWERAWRDSLGQLVIRTGKYLTVWHRQPDGAWKVAADVGVTDTPPSVEPTSTEDDSL